MKILVLNGPNINMLGIRQPNIYGSETYQTLVEKINQHATTRGVEVECKQSNHEGVLVDEIQAAYGRVDGIVLNPAAYTGGIVDRSAMPAPHVSPRFRGTELMATLRRSIFCASIWPTRR